MDGRGVDMPTPETLRQRVDAELRSEWDLYVAVRGERVVGMLALKPVPAILDQIFVAPGEQRKGIGKALLDVAKQRMRDGFTLRMAAANEEARRFYEAEGLERLGEGIHPMTGVPVQFYGWNVR